MSIHNSSFKLGENNISFETGKLANQTNSSVFARVGDTVVLATAVMSESPRDGIDFFPLLVDYEEKMYAAGKIKGSRFIKREGRASDEAILRGRVIDRTLRPLFPEGMRNDVQIVATVLSVDGVNDPDMLAVNAAAMALHISDIPFDGPVAGVRVGLTTGGQYIINPTKEQQETSKLDLIVCGTADHIMMIEAGASLVSESVIIDGVAFAQNYLKEICHAMDAFKLQLNRQKKEASITTISDEVKSWSGNWLTDDKIKTAFYTSDMFQRDDNVAELKLSMQDAAMLDLQHLADSINLSKEISMCFDKICKKYMQAQILLHDNRIDGRRLDETRKISCEVGLLPRTHGSALFTRGETQVLTVVTLGSKGDEQLLDGIEDPLEGRGKRYIHHYNFAGFSVGEVAPLRGAGRREIGHGALAERAVEVVLPEQESFPYTMRLVSETMSSNGSTSMASTCGSTLALMDAGVPIKEVIGGVAMGLVMDESNPSNFKVLTDIAGIEDFNGHMDFKVTGNHEGVTALQLDIKVKGLTVEILKTALDHAKPARQYIISKMTEVISSPRADLSPYAPRITSFMINPEKIREVIGTGGKVINEIIAATGVKIDIEDSGLVMVASTDASGSAKAVEWIKNIVKEVEVGEVYEGKVVRLMDFGAFVELLPGKDGMVHISELANHRVAKVTDIVKLGDFLKVQVKEIDDQGRVNLTHKPFAPKGVEQNNFKKEHLPRSPKK